MNDILGRGTKKYSSDNYIRANMLMAITSLRKICNHPDIFIYDDDEEIPDEVRYFFFKNKLFCDSKFVIVVINKSNGCFCFSIIICP